MKELDAPPGSYGLRIVFRDGRPHAISHSTKGDTTIPIRIGLTWIHQLTGETYEALPDHFEQWGAYTGLTPVRPVRPTSPPVPMVDLRAPFTPADLYWWKREIDTHGSPEKALAALIDECRKARAAAK